MRPRMKETSPLEPYITADQIMAFDPMRPETFTESRLLNTVLTVADRKQFHAASTVAEYLELNQRHLSGAIHIITGMAIDDILRMRAIPKILAEIKAHPGRSGDEVARSLGYGDHATLFRILGREKYDGLLSKRHNRP